MKNKVFNVSLPEATIREFRKGAKDKEMTQAAFLLHLLVQCKELDRDEPTPMMKPGGIL